VSGVEVIEVHEKDINRELVKDILFFKYAEPGAMGEPGGVLFIKADGKIYHFNYVYGKVDIRKKFRYFPFLKKSKVFGISFAEERWCSKKWRYECLGVGNHLLIYHSLYPLFKARTTDCKYPVELYQKWIERAEETLLFSKF
jgi:hypothetical protein